MVLALYVKAASLYPGGSVRYPESKGFDWVHNFWCDLLPTMAINGEINLAKPYGIAAMVLLCAVVIKVLGVASMICGALIFTSLHNIMIGTASLLALLPIFGIFRGLIRSRSKLHLSLGLVVLILLGFCNVIYYFRFLIEWLPLIQKIALAATLLWLVVMSISIKNRINAGASLKAS